MVRSRPTAATAICSSSSLAPDRPISRLSAIDPRKQFGSLQKIADTGTRRRQPRPGEARATEDNCPAIRREQTGSERENRRLAAATRSNERDRLARRYAQRTRLSRPARFHL